MTNENTANFKSYLLENGYKDNKDGTYIKTVSENNKNIKYIFASDSSVISKEITQNIDGGNINVLLNYEKNNQIDISLQFEGLNKNKIYGTLLQTGNYNAKKSSFDCKILMGNDFKSRCDDMKSEAKIFEKEVNELLNNSNTNAKYIS